MIRLTRGFYPNWDHDLERDLIERFDLPVRQRCRKLSKGMKSKLALLLASRGTTERRKPGRNFPPRHADAAIRTARQGLNG